MRAAGARSPSCRSWPPTTSTGRSVGSIVYTQFLIPKGGIESDVAATRIAENEFRIISGTSYVAGDLGWELYIAPVDALRVFDALMAAGQMHGIRPAGYKALDSLRIEKGYLYWSADITPEDSPFEAGLGFCVRPRKPDFIGREALIAIDDQGLNAGLFPGSGVQRFTVQRLGSPRYL